MKQRILYLFLLFSNALCFSQDLTSNALNDDRGDVIFSNIGIGTNQLTSPLTVGEFHGIKLSVGGTGWASKNILYTSWTSGIGDFTELNVVGKNLNSAFIRLIENGNVGIGTLSPKSKLEVAGQINSFNAAFGQSDIETSTKNYANFSTNNHGSVLISSNLYFSNNEDLKTANTHPSLSGGAIMLPGNGRPNQGKILFYTSNPAPVTENQIFSGAIAMEISGDGNVGIGKSNPTNKLDVKGTIHSQEVKVDMNWSWPDFVFKKDYALPTLGEVERHITEKGHLENIPSEEEVLKNGINLGEMNSKLLQKIEELTLYMIEQEKRTENLKMIISEQNKRLDKLENKQ
ncbi:hypothetical protein [Flavobacterium olei]|uniref:hypothetical protein n=1 Tax=Flavobacterium olei TaxID=1886782 RepID=UPI00321A9163